MLEQLFPKYHRRYAASPHAKELRAFAHWLDEVGYGRDPAHDHVRRLREALDHKGSGLHAHIDRAGLDDLFAPLPDVALYRATRRAFGRYLEARGRLLTQPDWRPHAATLVRYEDQLRTVRGLSASTVAQHLATIQTFLHEALPDGLPIDAIDWQAGTLRVEQRKTRSVLVLPMADRTLRIIKRYLFEGRPGSERPELFLRARGPAGPMKHYAVGNIYQTRAARSGLDLRGTSAYSLRHSFAMRLLERGVDIKAIGDVLGHRGLESTCVYLRLQLDALRDVALPVPRVAVAVTGGTQ